MKVYNHTTKKFVARTIGLIRGVVGMYENYVEYGYFKLNEKSCFIQIDRGNLYWVIDADLIDKDEYVYSPYIGCYIRREVATPGFLTKRGRGNYPYIINKEYGACKNLLNFENKQRLYKEPVNYKFAKDLKYSFGIEFETTGGYISNEMCFADGLIPLRDGSISGIEYSTVPLRGLFGINLLKQQLEHLKEYTDFNKECALHIHFGGFPVEEKYLCALWRIWNVVQFELLQYLPKFSYNTNKYKANCKSYCAPLPDFNKFNDMYEYVANDTYHGDLHQPHVYDLTRERKWQIHSRYHNMNLVNMMCYDTAKTIEFRFLRPTYNFEKIMTYIYLLQAVLEYAKAFADNRTLCDVEKDKLPFCEIAHILHSVYNYELAEAMIKEISFLSIICANQDDNGDYCGMRIDIEDSVYKHSNNPICAH